MQPILIAGPTASGKSAMAMTLARRLGGVVVNADSQQVYAEWRTLTARPTPEEEACVSHQLYGHVALGTDYSVGRWLDDLGTVLGTLSRDGLRPVITGGTGLYFKALTEGLAPIPQVSPDVRAQGEALLHRLGLRQFAEALARRDPATAGMLDMDNPRRVLRAWEVLEATGTGLADWKARTPPPVVPPGRCLRVSIVPDRGWLRERCETRFDTMMENGALEEAAAVRALGLPEGTPGLSAVGAAPLMAHLEGQLSLEEAIERAKIDTRQYAKRQLTWIRNQMTDWCTVDPSTSANAIETILHQAA